jgi:hypothetical protein
MICKDGVGVSGIKEREEKRGKLIKKISKRKKMI